ncbi:MAG: ABC transporter permease, partial [Actinomycetota bacterium]
MARYFVRLKLRLILNALRSGRGAVGLVVGLLLAVPLAIGGFGIFAFAARDEVAWAREIAVVGFTLLFLGWILLPVIGFGSDETLDPSRLALLPLTRRRLVAGLTAASCVGIPPLATLAVLAGTLPGYGRGAGTAVVAAAVAVELLLCVVASRAVVTALSRRLRSRKGRDTILVGVTLLALSLQAISFMQGTQPTALSGAAVRRVAGVLA